ncbi:MAG: pitrilysin family protein [bacterium]|nr:pitrilysin family protein [bacterium]
MKFESAMTSHGAPLYVFSMPQVQSIAVGVLVFAGTRDESWPKEAGIAHAIEHMVFQGNTRLGNSQAISAEIEDTGGMVNAWTSKEMTFYHRVIPDHAFGVAVQSLASQLSASLFRQVDIDKEMKNVVEEIKRASDNPAGFCERTISDVVYGSHPLGKDTLGVREAVIGFKTEDFQSWQSRFYFPKNYVFLVVGNITLEKALAVINGISFGRNNGERNLRPFISKVVQSERVRVVERDIQQANVCLGVAVGSSMARSTQALELYSTMLRGGMSFPLFQEVRDKRGLCYSIYSDVSSWSDRGIFQIYVGTNMERVEEAVNCIKDVVWKHRNDEPLLRRAKGLLLGSNAIRFCNPSTILTQAAFDVIVSGKPKSPEEINEEVRSVLLTEVTEAVERYLNPDNFSYAYVVPKGAKVSDKA